MCGSHCYCQHCADIDYYTQHLLYHSQMTRWLEQVHKYITANPSQNRHSHCCCTSGNESTTGNLPSKLRYSSNVSKIDKNDYYRHSKSRHNQCTPLTKNELPNDFFPSKRHYSAHVYPKHSDQVVIDDPGEYDDSEDPEYDDNEVYDDPEEWKKHDEDGCTFIHTKSKSQRNQYTPLSKNESTTDFYPTKRHYSANLYPKHSDQVVHDEPGEYKKYDNEVHNDPEEGKKNDEDKDKNSSNDEFDAEPVKRVPRRFYQKRYYKQKQTTYGVFDDYGNSVTRIGKPPKPNAQRDLENERKERKELYGDKAQRIAYLETDMAVKYTDLSDFNQIQLWPLLPVGWQKGLDMDMAV